MTLTELVEQPFQDILEKIAEGTPTPGGGAAAAASGATAAAILQMVAETTLKRKRYLDGWPAAAAAAAELPDIRRQLALAMSEDVVAYQQVVLVLSYQNENNNSTTIQALEDALAGAAQVPLKVAKLGEAVVRHGRELVEKGNVHAAADAAAACHIAAAAVRTSVTNVYVNLRDVSDEKLKKSWNNQANRLLKSVEERTADLHQLVIDRLSNSGKKGRARRR